jgi:hypothetical protein
MKLYRIYTENKFRARIERRIAMSFDSFTILTGKGYWQGTPEDCLVIEIIEDSAGISVTHLANWIKNVNDQESVMVTVQDIEVKMI